jgi:cobalt-zinc-cadmium efflux system outer membrane protein
MPLMNTFRSILLVVFFTIGSSSTGAEPARLPDVGADVAFADRLVPEKSRVQSVAHEVPFQPAGGACPESTPFANWELLPTGSDSSLSLEDLERMALANNPAIGQADARVRALRGRWVQVGLPPNPTAGYDATEIGNEGTAGQQGGFVGQEFITGGKLRLNRAVVSQEIQKAEQQLAAMQLRVQTDVRRSYYAALVAQRRADLAEELLGLSGQGVQASRELKDAEEIPLAGLLQSEVEQQTAMILSQTAKNEQIAAWRQLSAVVGTDLDVRPLAGDVSQLPALLDWEEQLLRVTTTSPEVSGAMAEVARSQNALARAFVERIPDVSTQLLVQKDNSTGDTITGVNIGLPLPLWNRNQGGIRQAQSEVTEARRNLDRVELNLKRRLAAAFQQYATARAHAETYRSQILPKSKETFGLVQRGYRLGELGYLDLLTAQRTYSQTNLAYLDALGALWASWTEIEGLLLTDSLSSSPE